MKIYILSLFLYILKSQIKWVPPNEAHSLYYDEAATLFLSYAGWPIDISFHKVQNETQKEK